MDDKTLFQKLHEFFGNKDNHHLTADAAKVGLWAVLLLNFNKATSWLGLKINEALVSERYEQASAKARKLWNGIVFGLKVSMWLTAIGWLITALILFYAKVNYSDHVPSAAEKAGTPEPWQVLALVAIAIELFFTLVTGAVILVQQIKAHALVQLAIAAESIFGSGVEFVKATLPKCVVPGADQRIDRKILDLAAGLDKGRKVFWAIIWWLKVLEIVIVDVLCVGYRVFNTLILVLLIVNVAIAFVAYKNAYGVDTKRFREWGFRYLWKTVIVGLIIVMIGAGTFNKLFTAVGFEGWLDGRIAKNADESKAKAETDDRAKKAQADMRKVKDAQNEIAAKRATAAAADLKVVQAAIEALENKVKDGGKLVGEDVKKLAMLQARWKWDEDGQAGLAPWLADAKAAPCEDGIDNDGDGYADREDFACYRLDPACKSGDSDCRDRFGNFQNGEAQTREVKAAKVRTVVKDESGNAVKDAKGKPVTQVVTKDVNVPVWYRYNPKLDEKKAEAKAEAKKPEPTAAASNPPAQHHANGKGATGPSEYQKLIAWKCSQNPQWCQKQ
jgi:hypothetical protein